MIEKFKSFLANDQIFLAVVVCLVGVLDFGLGRWSVVPPADQAGAVITIADSVLEPRSEAAPAARPAGERLDYGGVGAGASNPPRVTAPAEAVVVVASRNGTRYHLPNCPGASKLNQKI